MSFRKSTDDFVDYLSAAPEIWDYPSEFGYLNYHLAVHDWCVLARDNGERPSRVYILLSLVCKRLRPMSKRRRAIAESELLRILDQAVYEINMRKNTRYL